MKNILYAFLITICAVANCNICSAQTKFGCDYYGENPDLKTGSLTPAQLNATDTKMVDSVIDQIVKVVGLKRNFVIIPSNEIQYARAYNVPNKNFGEDRVIYFNPKIVNEFTINNQTNWKLLTILAHEVGHHLNGHVQQNLKSAPKLELEADEFSGFVANALGATLIQALQAINELPKEEATATHPSKADRMMAIIKGWQQAQAKIKETVRTDTLVINYASKLFRIVPKWHIGIGAGNVIVNPFNNGVRWNRSTFNSMNPMATLAYKLQADYAVYKDYVYSNATITKGSSTGCNYAIGYNHLGQTDNPYIKAGYLLNAVSLNYKMNYTEISLGAKVGTNKIKNMRAMLQVGAGIASCTTYVNALDANNEKYNFFDLSRDNINAKKELTAMYDNTCETKGENGGSNTMLNIQVAPTLQYYIKNKYYLQLQYAFSFTNTGYLDSYNWLEPTVEASGAFVKGASIAQNDNMSYLGIGFGYCFNRKVSK